MMAFISFGVMGPPPLEGTHFINDRVGASFAIHQRSGWWPPPRREGPSAGFGSPDAGQGKREQASTAAHGVRSSTRLQDLAAAVWSGSNRGKHRPSRWLGVMPRLVPKGLALIRRSIFGFTRVYNKLPQHIVDSESCNEIHHHLSVYAKDRCRAGASERRKI